VPKGYCDQSYRDKAIIARLVNVEFTKNMGMVGGGLKTTDGHGTPQQFKGIFLDK